MVGITFRKTIWNKEVELAREIAEDFFWGNGNPIAFIPVIISRRIQRGKVNA